MSMSDGHLGWTTFAKQQIVLNLVDKLSLHLASYRAGPKKKKLKGEEFRNMHYAAVTNSALTE